MALSSHAQAAQRGWQSGLMLAALLLVAFVLGRSSVRPGMRLPLDDRVTPPVGARDDQYLRLYDISDIINARVDEVLRIAAEAGPPPPMGSLFSPHWPVGSQRYAIARGAEDEVVLFIQSATEHAPWADAGGSGWIRFFGKRLAVYTRWEVHNRVAEILQKLRTEGMLTEEPQP